jgi:hypothetical protein
LDFVAANLHNTAIHSLPWLPRCVMFVRRYWLLLIPLALLFSTSAHAVTRVPLVIN